MNNTKDRKQMLANTEIFYQSVICIMYNPFLVPIVVVFFNGTPINSLKHSFYPKVLLFLNYRKNNVFWARVIFLYVDCISVAQAYSRVDQKYLFLAVDK